MNNIDFAARAKAVLIYNTQYLQGGFGCRLGKDWYDSKWDWNKKNQKLINSKLNTKPITFGFDCVGLVKGILWGFTGDYDAIYGGSRYMCNNVPDMTVSALKQSCGNLSSDFDILSVGELVFLGDSHVGIYIGNGEVVEASPAWQCKVQRTLLPVRNTTNYEKLPVRKWDVHGICPYVEHHSYENAYRELSAKYGELEDKMRRIKEVIEQWENM